VRPRAAAATSVAAYGLAQAVNTLGGLVRIPLIVGALGSQGYGLFVVITSLWPWLAAPGEAWRETARAGRGYPGPPGDALHRAYVSAAVLATGAGIAALTLQTEILPRADGVSSQIAAYSVLVLALTAALSVSPASIVGASELAGRAHTVNLFSAASTLVGLPLLILAISLRETMLAIVSATAIGFAAPYLLASLTLRGRIRTTRHAASTGPSGFGAMLIWTTSALVGSGLDALIVGSVVGADAAASYGVALRLLTLATVVTIALSGFTTGYFTRLRQTEPGSLLVQLKRFGRLYILVSLVSALTFVLVGPDAASLLTRDAVAAPTSLYVLLGVVAFSGGAASPYLAALASTRGRRFRSIALLTTATGNVVTSVWAASVFGLVGPAACSAVAGLALLCAARTAVRLRPSLVLR
jgi:O-antigen/teichoic acid export membrane protein